MAKHLARIHGTEEDKVNCPFYYKIGACRHADRCSRLHHKPAFSQTLLFQHLYQPPPGLVAPPPGDNPNNENNPLLEDFLCFYEDMYLELSKFGRLEGLYIADNVADHLVGHVYAKFRDEEDATDCLQVMHGRYYNGRLIIAEYSPVSDFREARCRDYDEMDCQRGGYCNFLHAKPVPYALLESLEEEADADRRRAREEERSRKRRKRDGGDHHRSSSDRDRDRGDRDRDRDRHHRHDDDRDREGRRSSSRRD